MAILQEGLTLEEFLKLPDESPALEFHYTGNALTIAECGYVMESGRIVLAGPREALPANPKVQASFIGI
jgi:hypothetical protein